MVMDRWVRGLVGNGWIWMGWKSMGGDEWEIDEYGWVGISIGMNGWKIDE